MEQFGGSWGGLGGSGGGLGASGGVVWADSGSQARLGRRPGRLMGDFSGLDGPNLDPKMASSWGPVAQKSMPTSIEFLMPLKIETWMEQIDILMENVVIFDLIWDEILIICTYRN